MNVRATLRVDRVEVGDGPCPAEEWVEEFDILCGCGTQSEIYRGHGHTTGRGFHSPDYCVNCGAPWDLAISRARESGDVGEQEWVADYSDIADPEGS